MIMDVQQEGRVNKHSLAKMRITMFFNSLLQSGSPAFRSAEGRIPTRHPTQGLHLTPDLMSQGTDPWARMWARPGQ